MPKDEQQQEDIEELRRNARRYQQLLDHPRDAHHLFALLLAHTRTNIMGREYLNRILDQLHIQDLAKGGTLAAARVWQQGGADGETGTERAATVVLDARAQVSDAQIAARIVNHLAGAPTPHADVIADRVLSESLAVIDSARLRRAQKDGHNYEGPERRKFRAGFKPENLVNADLADMEVRILASGSEEQFAAMQDYAKDVQSEVFKKGAGDA